jgi:hypothetical protein
VKPAPSPRATEESGTPSPENVVSRTPRAPGAPPVAPEDDRLELPHERDQSLHGTAQEPDPAMQQAHEDLAQGQVDTDMRATPGLDAEQRARKVPGPGGQRPKTGAAPGRKA